MKTKNMLLENSDFTHCPITRLPIRHPVHTSDGRYYELKELLAWLLVENKSPVTKIPITSIIYDITLKKSLDSLSLPGRAEDYDREDYLQRIQALVQAPVNPRTQTRFKSTATFSSLLFISLIFDVLSNDTNTKNHAPLLFCLTLLLSLSDYAIRTYSNGHYNLFSVPDLLTKDEHLKIDAPSFANEINMDYNFK